MSINSMEQSSWKTGSSSSGQEILRLYGTQEFIIGSQKPATGPYPEPVEPRPHSHTTFS
jgi:hypothetical protein